MWIRGDASVFLRFKYADNAVGHQFAGLDARIQDSIFVGKSDNIGSRFDSRDARSRPYSNPYVPILGYRV